jgi:hypothetical protein
MKNKILTAIILITTISCSKNEEAEPINSNPHNLQNIGLSASTNIYPLYPNTWSAGLGDNQWYDSKVGDTLIVSRRADITDDSGDMLYYKFLVKNNNWIVPLNVTRVSTDAYIVPPRNNQLMINKPIVNFRLQQYIENQVLACEIETVDGNGLNYPLVDRMWIKLND